MALHHRHKQRILTTIVTLIIFIIAADTFIILNPVLELETSLLFAFAVAIGLTTAYQCYNYRHSHEHVTLVNTLTQIFMGTILFASAVIMLLLRAIFQIDVLNSYLYMSLIVIILIFIFLKRFDEFLEREVQGKFPMGKAPAPAPKVNPVKNMQFKHKRK
jgi:hypothetical protein